jgi:hypothetical protein
MMARRGVLGLLAGTATFALAGCGKLFGFPRASLRYRMTVEIETPEGIKIGSSVLESTLISGPNTGAASGLTSSLKGEAVAVDVGGGQTLFALLSSPSQHSASDYQDQLFNNALEAGAVSVPPMPRLYKSSEWAEMRKMATELKPKLTLPPALYPMLVRFRNIADPKSIEAVEPDALAATFGAGVTLKRITLAVTDDPVTSGIEKKLVWWTRAKQAGGNLIPMVRTTVEGRSRFRVVDGYDETLADIGLSYFSTETYK